jgi:hypothetical protein
MECAYYFLETICPISTPVADSPLLRSLDGFVCAGHNGSLPLFMEPMEPLS